MRNRGFRQSGLWVFWEKQIKKIPNYLLLIFIFVLVLTLVRNIQKIQSANRKIRNTQEEVERLMKEQKELEEELSKVNSEEYIEKQLRDRLGMAKEGEIVIILPDEAIVKRFAPKLEDEQDSLPDPNWKKWAKLFGL